MTAFRLAGGLRSIRENDLLFPERVAIGLEAELAAFEADQRAFGDADRAGRILGDERPQRFLVPGLAMLDVENGVDVEIATVARRQAEAAQPPRDAGGAAWTRPRP